MRRFMERVARPKLLTLILVALLAVVVTLLLISGLAPLARFWADFGTAAFLLPLPLALIAGLRRLRKRKISASLVTGILLSTLLFAVLAQVATGAVPPERYYLHDTATSGISPAGEHMNATQGTTEATLVFDTVGQTAYWYVDETWPTGSDDFGLNAGNYTFNMYFSELPPAWYGDWSFRKKITINSTKVTADESDFPVLIKETDTDLRDDAQNDGDDILFTSSDGTTKLNHEIERFNGTTGELVAWVNVTSLSSSVDTDIYLYYGNTTATNQENVAGTWDSDYVSVWHLDGTPPATMVDSAGMLDGTPANMDAVDQVDGEIDGSLDFDGSNDEVSTATTTALDNAPAVTLEAWVKAGAQTEWAGVVTKRSSASGAVPTTLEVRASGVPRFGIWNTSSFSAIDSTTVLSNVWTHIVGVYDGSDMRLYLNGSLDTGPTSKTGNLLTLTRPFYVGRNPWDAVTFTGGIDEVRVSSSARSSDWIATEYNNQNDTATFYSVGIEESDTSGDVQITVHVHHTRPDGSDPQEIVTSSAVTIDNATTNPLFLNVGGGAEQAFTASDPRRLRLLVNVTAVSGTARFVLAYNSTANPTNLETPVTGVRPLLVNPTLAPTSGTTTTNFNFTVDYRHPDGTPANVVRVNVSDAPNGTYNNFTMSPTEDPDVNYFVQAFQDVNGTTSNFANAQSDSDSGASALLTQESAGTAYARPDFLLFNPGVWLPNPVEDQINEVTPDDATTMVTSQNSPDPTDEFRVRLSDVADPGTSTGHIMRFRARGDSGARDNFLEMRLFQGTTQIASTGMQDVTQTWTTFTYTLTAAEADSITDYTDLRFRFIPDTQGSGSQSKIDVTWAEFEVPGASSTELLIQFNTTGIRSTGEDLLVIRYNLTSSDDTFGVWVWNFTAADWTNRGTLDQTAVSFLNYSLTADEKSAGEVRIRFNDTSDSGSTDLSIDYQLVNNTLWTTGVTYYVNTTLAAGEYTHFFRANDTAGVSNRTATLSGPSVHAPPVLSNFRLENATAASRAGEQLDVDVEHFFLFNVTDESGWGDIGDDGNVSLRLWYDGNVSTTTQRDPTVCEAVGNNWTNCQDAFSSNNIYAYANDTGAADSAFQDGVSVAIPTTKASIDSITTSLASGDNLVFAFVQTTMSVDLVFAAGDLELRRGTGATDPLITETQLSHSGGSSGATGHWFVLMGRDAGAPANPTYAVHAAADVTGGNAEVKFLIIHAPPNSANGTSGIVAVDGTATSTLLSLSTSLPAGDNVVIAVSHFKDNAAEQQIIAGDWQLKRDAAVLASNQERINIKPVSNRDSSFGMLIARDAGAPANPTYVVNATGDLGTGDMDAETWLIAFNGFSSAAIDTAAVAVGTTRTVIGTVSTSFAAGDDVVIGAFISSDAGHDYLASDVEVGRVGGTMSVNEFDHLTHATALRGPYSFGVRKETTATANPSYEGALTATATGQNADLQMVAVHIKDSGGGGGGPGMNDTAWRDFGFALGSATINTVQVGVEWFRNNTAPILNVTVSWDGGTTWATNQTATNKSSDDDTVEWLDFTSATAWTPAKLNDANLRVRIGANASGARLDYVTVRVISTSELTFGEQTTGANYRIVLRYVDTSDPATASLSEWSVVEGRATYNASASSLTAITDGYEFKLALKFGFQVKQANDPTNSTAGGYNDLNSWNAEVVAFDGSDTATLQTASTGEHMEFGVYMYTFVNISADWAVTVAAGSSGSTNTVTVYYRANDDFRMTIWFTTHLVKGADTIDISNVTILAAADPNDNITSDFAFVGLGEANATYIFGSATWWFAHATDADENTAMVQFSVSIPGGSPTGTYIANLTIKVQQEPAG